LKPREKFCPHLKVLNATQPLSQDEVLPWVQNSHIAEADPQIMLVLPLQMLAQTGINIASSTHAYHNSRQKNVTATMSSHTILSIT
jgi:hypothetical protein